MARATKKWCGKRFKRSERVACGGPKSATLWIVTPEIPPRPPSWRLPIARSVVALGLAAALSASRGPTVAWLASAFSAYCLADALIFVLAALRRSVLGIPSTGLLVRGLAGLGASLAVVAAGRGRPETLHALIVGWAILSGAFDMACGACARDRLDGDRFLRLHGLVTAFLGLVLSLLPPAAVADTVDLIAVYAVMAASLLLLLGARIAISTAPQHALPLQRST
jgi:hypothetical protein